MSLEDIMLTEISKPKKEKYCIFHFYVESKIVKFIESNRGTIVAKN